MATIATAKVENLGKISGLNAGPTAEVALSSQPPPSSVLGIEESKVKLEDNSVKISGVEGDGEVTDVQKKMKRAERFGVVVQLTEEEKRNTRAERFGTGTAVNGSDSSRTSEELKRKARAERFGSAQSTTSADEETKKKARLARFGSFSKFDQGEEDKKKARAARFSNNSSPLSKEDDEGKIQKKKAIVVDKAGART